jgi:hypothetical protein
MPAVCSLVNQWKIMDSWTSKAFSGCSGEEQRWKHQGTVKHSAGHGIMQNSALWFTLLLQLADVLVHVLVDLGIFSFN